MTEDQTTPASAAPKTPWLIADLEAKLKANGMKEIEGLAHAVVASVFDWIQESVQASDSKIDDFALAVLPPLRSFIDSKIDGIAK